jgi:RNA polymerase sigma-70 factor (ECF subfamily)
MSVEPPRPVDFRRVFETEAPYVWTTLRRLGVPDRDRADVTHDVFVAVHRQLHTYDSARPLRPWLFGFAFRYASDYRKRARHHHEVFVDEPAEPRQPTVPPVDDQVATRSLLERLLQHLDEDKRVVVVMHEIEGWPVPEIAAMLGVPVQTAYSRLRAARIALTQALSRLESKAAP